MDGAAVDMRRLDKQTLSEVSHDLFGKTVLICGAFGTVGPKLISSMLKRGCKRVVVLDNYASQLSALLEKASMDSGKEKIIPVLGGRNWEQQAEQVFRDYAPQIVLQTATRKYLLPHVPPDLEFIQRSNLSRSFNLAKLAMAHQAEIFCIISSHEADNGKNPISSSLKNMENELIAAFSSREKTKLAIVRLCDLYENSPDCLRRIIDGSSGFRQVRSAAPVQGLQLISMDTAIEFILGTIVDKIEGKTQKSLFEIEPIKLSSDERKILADTLAYS
jgi:nucleoside-diphosphate-sugar epimerase